MISAEGKQIIIENKIYAVDQDNQLIRYHNFRKGNTVKLYYLTLDGCEPSPKVDVVQTIPNRDDEGKLVWFYYNDKDGFGLAIRLINDAGEIIPITNPKYEEFRKPLRQFRNDFVYDAWNVAWVRFYSMNIDSFGFENVFDFQNPQFLDNFIKENVTKPQEEIINQLCKFKEITTK